VCPRRIEPRSTEARDERTAALAVSRCIGLSAPLRRLTEASVLRAMTSRSLAATAWASKWTWPGWIRSKQPLANPIFRPRLRHSAICSAASSTVTFSSLANQIPVSELLTQISAADHGGSRPRDRNPRGDVGEMGRLLEIRVAGECGSQRRDECVAGARYVGDFLHARRQVERRHSPTHRAPTSPRRSPVRNTSSTGHAVPPAVPSPRRCRPDRLGGYFVCARHPLPHCEAFAQGCPALRAPV
jgi:hypothetical protein